ncbi:hypothetical protein H2198_009934, partial [Neophaeococcomyces mojaviensis]
FSFLFADDAQSACTHHWITAEVVPSETGDGGGRPILAELQSLPADPSTMQSTTSPSSYAVQDDENQQEDSITDLCAVLKNVNFDSRPARRRLGFISDPNNRHKFWLSTRFDHLSSATTKRSFRLAETLGRRLPSQGLAEYQAPSWFDMHTRHRVELCLMLAWGVLHFSSTGWLQGNWTKDNILLVVDPSDKIRPYVTHRFESSRRNSEAPSLSPLTPLTPNRITKWTGNDALFALAVSLIEICHGETIENLAEEDEKHNGEVKTFLTALRLSCGINNRVGMRYAQAVHACLHSKVKVDATGRAVDLAEFAKCVFKDIIMPLKDLASVFEEF